MKIAVLSYSGNVGKSTLAQHLLRPRIPGASMFYIESINAGGGDSQVSGGEFSSVVKEMYLCDAAIVDIGSSNIEKVLDRARSMKGVLDNFDYFLLPVVPKNKQEIDTIKLIRDLVELGISANKIKVVCNQLQADDRIEKLFPSLIPVLEPLGIAWAAVQERETFGLLHEVNLTVKEAVASGFDFKAAIRGATDIELKRDFATRQILSLMAKSTTEEFDLVFLKLFPETADA